MNVAELSPEKKLEYLRDCILDVRSGANSEILCPYCGEINYRTNEFLCCSTFNAAMDAVLKRLEEQDATDLISKVCDRAEKGTIRAWQTN